MKIAGFGKKVFKPFPSSSGLFQTIACRAMDRREYEKRGKGREWLAIMSWTLNDYGMLMFFFYDAFLDALFVFVLFLIFAICPLIFGCSFCFLLS